MPGGGGSWNTLHARIFAVVNVYDAMTSNLSYGAAFSKAYVLDYIRAQSGKFFDSEVVEAFLKMMENNN